MGIAGAASAAIAILAYRRFKSKPAHGLTPEQQEIVAAAALKAMDSRDAWALMDCLLPEGARKSVLSKSDLELLINHKMLGGQTWSPDIHDEVAIKGREPIKVRHADGSFTTIVPTAEERLELRRKRREARKKKKEEAKAKRMDEIKAAGPNAPAASGASAYPDGAVIYVLSESDSDIDIELDAPQEDDGQPDSKPVIDIKRDLDDGTLEDAMYEVYGPNASLWDRLQHKLRRVHDEKNRKLEALGEGLPELPPATLVRLILQMAYAMECGTSPSDAGPTNVRRMIRLMPANALTDDGRREAVHFLLTYHSYLQMEHDKEWNVMRKGWLKRRKEASMLQRDDRLQKTLLTVPPEVVANELITDPPSLMSFLEYAATCPELILHLPALTFAGEAGRTQVVDRLRAQPSLGERVIANCIYTWLGFREKATTHQRGVAKRIRALKLARAGEIAPTSGSSDDSKIQMGPEVHIEHAKLVQRALRAAVYKSQYLLSRHNPLADFVEPPTKEEMDMYKEHLTACKLDSKMRRKNPESLISYFRQVNSEQDEKQRIEVESNIREMAPTERLEYWMSHLRTSALFHEEVAELDKLPKVERHSALENAAQLLYTRLPRVSGAPPIDAETKLDPSVDGPPVIDEYQAVVFDPLMTMTEKNRKLRAMRARDARIAKAPVYMPRSSVALSLGILEAHVDSIMANERYTPEQIQAIKDRARALMPLEDRTPWIAPDEDLSSDDEAAVNKAIAQRERERDPKAKKPKLRRGTKKQKPEVHADLLDDPATLGLNEAERKMERDIAMNWCVDNMHRIRVVNTRGVVQKDPECGWGAERFGRDLFLQVLGEDGKTTTADAKSASLITDIPESLPALLRQLRGDSDSLPPLYPAPDTKLKGAGDPDIAQAAKYKLAKDHAVNGVFFFTELEYRTAQSVLGPQRFRVEAAVTQSPAIGIIRQEFMRHLLRVMRQQGIRKVLRENNSTDKAPRVVVTDYDLANESLYNRAWRLAVEYSIFTGFPELQQHIAASFAALTTSSDTLGPIMPEKFASFAKHTASGAAPVTPAERRNVDIVSESVRRHQFVPARLRKAFPSEFDMMESVMGTDTVNVGIGDRKAAADAADGSSHESVDPTPSSDLAGIDWSASKALFQDEDVAPYVTKACKAMGARMDMLDQYGNLDSLGYCAVRDRIREAESRDTRKKHMRNAAERFIAGIERSRFEVCQRRRDRWFNHNGKSNDALPAFQDESGKPMLVPAETAFHTDIDLLRTRLPEIIERFADDFEGFNDAVLFEMHKSWYSLSMREAVEDMYLAWELLAVPPYEPEEKRAFTLLRIEVARRLRDPRRMVEPFNQLRRYLPEEREEEIVAAFTVAPLLGKWNLTRQLGDIIEDRGLSAGRHALGDGLHALHLAALFRQDIPDYEVLHAIAGDEAKFGDNSECDLKFQQLKIMVCKRTAITVECDDVLQKHRVETSYCASTPVRPLLPKHCSVITRTGAVATMISFSNSSILISGACRGNRMVMEGYATVNGANGGKYRQTEEYVFRRTHGEVRRFEPSRWLVSWTMEVGPEPDPAYGASALAHDGLPEIIPYRITAEFDMFLYVTDETY
jgi:hypothetical protein